MLDNELSFPFRGAYECWGCVFRPWTGNDNIFFFSYGINCECFSFPLHLSLDWTNSFSVADRFLFLVLQPVDFSKFPYADKKFQFFDHYLITCIQSKKDKDTLEFFKLLALCHTVMVEEKEGGEVKCFNPKWKYIKCQCLLMFIIAHMTRDPCQDLLNKKKQTNLSKSCFNKEIKMPKQTCFHLYMFW